MRVFDVIPAKAGIPCRQSLWTPAFAGVTLLFFSLQGHAVEVKPVVDAQLMGGQNYYNGSESSFGGVASLTLAPYTQFNDRWSLVPLYAGHYRGTKQVTDLVGGGTLFQDSQSHTFSTKLIRTYVNGWKIKGVGGYGIDLLRETEDEEWSKGLYDSRRLFIGTEAEWSWRSDHFLRFAYDHYRIRFPNYDSLESGLVGSGLGRELSQPDVLDNTNHALAIAGRMGLPGSGYADFSTAYTLRRYADQHIVTASGDLSGDSRSDNLWAISMEGTWPVSVKSKRRLFTSAGYSGLRLGSNQSHYDADQVVFNSNYYSYVTHSISNRWTLLLGKEANPWTVNLNGAISRQTYADRRTQNAAGAYGSDTTRVDSAYIGLGASYPIAKGFRLAANAYFGWSDSNNHFTRLYQYHYNTQTYLMGFTYAY